jgi:hypothetical protein
VLAISLLAACGGNMPQTDNPVIEGTELTIDVTGGGAPPETYTLTCDPIGGTVPSPKKVCAALVAPQHNPFPGPRARAGCKERHGDGTLHVTGTWRGRELDVSYDQATTCSAKLLKTAAKTLGVTRPVVTASIG